MDKDLIQKRCLGDNRRFADLMNGYVFEGKQVLQAEQIKKKVKKQKGIAGAEFVSGFKKNSRLHPCITLVVYFGDNWDGSRDLHGILDFTDIPEELRKYVNNYQMHLLEVKKLENTDIFQTDLKQIFDFIRCSKDRNKLRELVENDSAFQEMEEDAYDMALAYANAEELIGVKKYHGKDGKVNMCEGIRGLVEEGRMEGRLEGELEKTRNIIRNMLKRGMSEEDIKALAECDQAMLDEVKKSEKLWSAESF